ncbi:hypothetical protein AWC38_SpisGene14199 [Stylophora pistillata]|uniref:Peptidase aspartic putative domain-containing protein n=1 Tax=Stylophora pistillata TaxID=50429 RepID=A0A2B4RX18_STYPI|nr:hypothetical protein AWC38_SpisGene14199 [Stylophora pistillata]
MVEDALKTAKTERRTAKGTLTRCGKFLAKLLEAKRPEQEVRDGLSKLQLAFDNLVAKHDHYSRLIEDDSEFEVQEGWMADCQEDFMSKEIGAKIYLDSFLSKGKAPLQAHDTSTASKGKNNGVGGPGSSGIPSIQIEDDVPCSNTLLDWGAQISIIRDETAAALGLKGNDTEVTIIKVGGEEKTIKTKVYKVPVSAPDITKMFSIKAIGIPCISEEVAAVQLKPIAKLLGLENERIRRPNSPVDLLIGIDHAQMHTGQTRQTGQLVARKTPLGQVVFGGPSEAAEVLTKNSYMDDICGSVDTVMQAQKLTGDLDKVLGGGGFAVKGWTSNKVLINTEVQERGFKIFQGEVQEKMLGVVWNYVTDEFSFKVKVDLPLLKNRSVDREIKMTTRTRLSEAARFYDPIGFEAAFIIRARIGLQELWQIGLNWDDELPCEVQQKWTQLFEEMKELDQIGFKRCLVSPKTPEFPALCVFSDASQEAFEACAYIRQKTKQGTYEVNFIAA